MDTVTLNRKGEHASHLDPDESITYHFKYSDDSDDVTIEVWKDTKLSSVVVVPSTTLKSFIVVVAQRRAVNAIAEMSPQEFSARMFPSPKGTQ